MYSNLLDALPSNAPILPLFVVFFIATAAFSISQFFGRKTGKGVQSKSSLVVQILGIIFDHFYSYSHLLSSCDTVPNTSAPAT
jgi:hypothetical protein